MRYVLTLLFVLGALLLQPLRVSAQFPENTNFTVCAFIQPANRMLALAAYTAAKHLETSDLMKASIDFSLTYLTPGCNRRLPMRAIVNIIDNNRRAFDNVGSLIHGILVGSCENVCFDMANIGSIHQISVMTFGCKTSALNRDLGFKSFVRSITSENYLPMLIHDISVNRQWLRAVLFQKQVADVYDSTDGGQITDGDDKFSLKMATNPVLESWAASLRKVKNITRGRMKRFLRVISNLSS